MNTLSELIYEPVNEEYGWGLYGEFRVLIRRKDGYVNVTKLCKDGGKELSDWTRLERQENSLKKQSGPCTFPGTSFCRFTVRSMNYMAPIFILFSFPTLHLGFPLPSHSRSPES
jgi:hypothetical protein